MAKTGRLIWRTRISILASLLMVAALSVRADDEPTSGPVALTLPRLLDIAVQNNPELAVARARADAARGQLIQAGLYPNPVVAPGVEELGNKDGPAGISGIAIEQEIITAGKLRLAQAAAAYGVAAADWQATTRWFEVVTRVRQAYYEALTANRELETSELAVKIAQDGLDAVRKLEKAGVRARPDVLRALVEVDQNRVRLQAAQQRQEAARRLLAAVIGLPALPPGPLAGSIEQPTPIYVYQASLETVLVRSSEVQAAQAAIRQAEQLLLRAQAERIPNVRVLVRPGYSEPDKRSVEVNLETAVALPLFNRNQGNILAAEADVRRATADARAVELRLTERLATAFRRYAAAKEQVEIYDKQILPNADEALRLVRLGYERGDPKYDYTAVLEAQRTLVQARLMDVQARGELWRAASEIAGLLQDDAGLPPCPTR
jgi:cobalt-zinc-cadmium efflux system outer membrane protein